MTRWPVILPSLLLGLTVAAYWYRVLRMAYKARRLTGRAAHFLPPELLGRLLRAVWIPVVVIWVASPFLDAALTAPPRPVRPLWRSAPLSWCATAVAAACFAATRVCWRRMGKAWRMGIDPSESTSLVANGPFAYVRHPIYALSAVMMLATVVAVPTPAMIGAGAAHVALLVWESRREERYLLRVHGNAYRSYRARVGAFLPRPRKRPAGAR